MGNGSTLRNYSFGDRRPPYFKFDMMSDDVIKYPPIEAFQGRVQRGAQGA